MFERFTSDARLAVKQAQDEARDLRHPQIGPEHLLIALAGGEHEAAQALKAHHLDATSLRRRLLTLTDGALDQDALATLGIDLDQVRRATEAHLGPGVLDRAPRPPLRGGHLPFSKEAKKVLELALREALHLKSREIRSGHLLLGILRDGEGPAIALLQDAHVEPAALHNAVLTLMPAHAAAV